VTLHPAAGVAIVLVLLGSLLGALRLVQIKWAPHPELVRKLLHVAMGLVTLTFPWLFDSPWPVVSLAVMAAGGMLAVRRFAALRSGVGSVVHGVERESGGEIYFPLAVAAVFYLSRGDPVLYTIPVLLLTLADALAALIGVRYGQLKFATFEGARKSLEGAVAFFLTAFLCTHVTLLLATEVGRVETLLIGIETGFLVMLVELVAWKGLDNLFIPLFSFAVLYNIQYLGTLELTNRLAVLVLLSVFFFLWRRRTTLDLSATIAALLIAYVMWAIGGLEWLAPAAACFATYAILWPEDRARLGQVHDLRGVMSFSAVALVWLFLSTRHPELDWAYLGTVAFAVQLAAIGRAASHQPGADAWGLRAFVRCTLVGWVVPFIPFVLLRGFDTPVLQLAAAAIPAVAVALAAFSTRWTGLSGSPHSMRRWVVQAAASGVGSLLALAPWILLQR